MRAVPLVGLIVALLVSSGALAASPAPVGAEHGMVVTAQQHATRIGVEVLKNGGNAIDAAVAVGYALAVVYPAAGNLGGGGFMTVQFADGRKTFIDFRESAPLAARPNMYLDKDGNVIPDLSTRGHLAVAVPGTVAGLEFARDKYGTVPRAKLIEPALRLAEQGFVLEQGDVDMLREGTDDFRKDAPSAAIFLHQGKPFAAGAKLVQRDLARTLRNVSLRGANGFYKGETAVALAAASKAGGGILTQADLNAYHVRELPPLECNYRGFQIVSAPPPSSGGIVLCEMLHILEGYPLASYGWGSARAVHFEIEAMRHAYVDRNHLLGDPSFVSNPLAQLLDKSYANTIRARIDPAHAGNSMALKP
ncbi:MAG TPA: gamma-glutamyltransferase family protein, partial [Steroidobacteraceae bacterium]|nr:gamma-glutamyltransferase family protein [Steroidobacteraceae bacterium]